MRFERCRPSSKAVLRWWERSAMLDPHAPAIEAWLASLRPRDELIMRYAMRSAFPQVRGDRAFDGRIDVLRDRLRLTEDELAKILNRARQTQKNVALLLVDRSAPTGTAAPSSWSRPSLAKSSERQRTRKLRISPARGSGQKGTRGRAPAPPRDRDRIPASGTRTTSSFEPWRIR
jgi:hypothetical protein